MRQHTPLSAQLRRDPRRYRFAMPNAVWEYTLRPVEFVLLSYLCCYQDQVFDLNRIAKGVGMAVGTVKKYLAALSAKGLVTDELRPTVDVQWSGGKFFTLPKEIFLLELSPSAFVVYAYLLLVEDRRTHKCHSSIRTIAAAAHLAVSTVMKSINELAERQLIAVEHTTYLDNSGMKWTGNNCYTLLSTRVALSETYRRRLERLELDTEQERIRRQQIDHDRRHPREALCGAGTGGTDPCPTEVPAPRSRDLRGTKRNAGESPGAFQRQGGHNCPQCGQFLGGCGDAFAKGQNGH